jgi:hypothetical protein
MLKNIFLPSLIYSLKTNVKLTRREGGRVKLFVGREFTYYAHIAANRH